MADQTIVVPSDLIRSMQQFTDQMNKFVKFAQTMKAPPRPPSQQRTRQVHSHFISNIRRFDSALTRTENILSRAVSRLTTGMGPLGRRMIASFDVEGMLARIPFESEGVLMRIGATSTAATAISVFLLPVVVVAETIKYLIIKTFQLAGPTFTDFMTASGMGTDIGGFKAFNLTFGPIGASLEGMVRAQIDLTSTTFRSQRLLGIRRMLDSSDEAVAGIVAAAQYLKTLPTGNVMPMAAAMGLTDRMSEATIRSLLLMSPEALQKKAETYAKRRRAFKISPDVIEKMSQLHRSIQGFVTNTQTLLLKKLTEGHPSLIEALTDLSDATAKWVKAWLLTLGRALNRDWIKLVQDMIVNLTEFFIKAANALRQWLRMPLIDMPSPMERGALFRPSVGPRARAAEPPPGPFISNVPRGPRGELIPRGGIRRYTGPTHPRIHAPPAEPGPFISNIARAPGVPMPKGGIRRYTGPTHPRIHAAPIERAEREPSGLRVPTKPEEAPETTAAAVKGGFTRGGGEIDRSRFAAELQANPALRDKVLRIAANEQGNNPQGTQAVLESMMNRAAYQHTTLAAQARWHESEGGYYQQGSMGRGALENPAHRAVLEKSLSNTLNGSNISNYATDNASGDLADKRVARGDMKKTYGAGGETFFSPGPVSGQGNIDKYDKWRSNLKPGGTQGFTTEDIRRGLGAPQVSTGQPSTSTDATPQGDKRLTTVGNYKLGGDQRRGALIQAAGEASKNLPPGWRVEAYSGQRDQGPHSYGGAIDFRLIDPQGHELPNYQDPKYYGIYEKFAQDTHLALQKTNPELAAQHRWGGYFSGPLGPNGQYGAMDLMHQDFAGGDARMAAGQWKTGINSEWRQRWGVTDYSSGIADRARSNTATLAPTPDQAAPAVVDQSGQVRQPAGPETNQANRPYRLQGQVALGGKTFDWASGGHARGSLPYGSYPINIGQGDIGPVGQQIGSVATVGGKGGVIDDPKYPGAPRTGIQIHSWSAPSLDKLYSDGCFTVPTEEWPAFKKALLDEAAKHPEGLSLTVNRNNTASIEPYHVARERAENQTGKDEQAPTMKYDKPPAWPKEGSKPIQYAGSTDDHDSAPKNKVKIEHNDSDHDIHVQENATSDLSTAPI